METPDSGLLRRYSEEHSQSAFAEFVERHIGLVYSTALRQACGDTHCALGDETLQTKIRFRPSPPLLLHYMATALLLLDQLLLTKPDDFVRQQLPLQYAFLV
jgi:hypothetical protein